MSYQLPLYETLEGCPLVLRSVEFDFYAKWGKRDTDVGGDIGGIFIRDPSGGGMPGVPEAGVQELRAQCQWLFRTAGLNHAIRKILKCNSLDDQGKPQRLSAGGTAQRDQLVNKKLRMLIAVTNEERPYMGNTWVRFPLGWKRCLGKGLNDQYGFCQKEMPAYRSFRMPDGRDCNVYPTCTE